jgi:hypothetical protein
VDMDREWRGREREHDPHGDDQESPGARDGGWTHW